MAVWLYHKDYPEGKIFEDITEEEAKRLDAEGWVDTPAKLKRRPGRPPKKVKEDGNING